MAIPKQPLSTILSRSKLRFFVCAGEGAYRWIVCDNDEHPKAIAKFKDKLDATLFVNLVRRRHTVDGFEDGD